ncbi:MULTISPECIES: glycosyltransferase family 2 protein [Pseudomonas aeruginosa group]|uniref:glycosyltransferase family 2 protein n=1 Tax=Pseudomonas aeruginosa group TaxID=136841 RepID=UPI001A308191|nr:MULTISPECIES: glycosyltransferase [Pseudomonas aeruginosa group]MBG6886118.1 glycosyltransferase [Pseudomonas aeruginosa]MCY0315482.1 glycosyltransferase [Pseudomonas aeruginosa]MCY0517497.1 glycosyltransferase [Pseudomonas aeruginosa]MDI3610658.1 glycosyltransferase [Pseudomonas aeruginosa]MDI3677559.1 glycosyltransferase [Pseudomonas aeruginosa]
MKLSVIMPVHAKPERLRLCLASLRRQQERCDFETLIVADAACPAVLAQVAEQPHARLLTTPGLGRAGARNLGASAAQGEVLLFIDDDVLVLDGFFEAHLQAQAQRPGLVHGRIRELIALCGRGDPRLGTIGCPPILPQDLLLGRWNPQSSRLATSPLEQAAEHPRCNEWPWLASAGANLSIQREHWQRVGGFDEAYGKRWGMEDLDLGWRLWQAGVPISLEREACAYHLSHYNPTRWEEHAPNLAHFQARANTAEALALDALLCPTGSLARYIERLDQIRQQAPD